MNLEKTLVILKPSAVQRGLVEKSLHVSNGKVCNWQE